MNFQNVCLLFCSKILCFFPVSFDVYLRVSISAKNDCNLLHPPTFRRFLVIFSSFHPISSCLFLFILIPTNLFVPFFLQISNSFTIVLFFFFKQKEGVSKFAIVWGIPQCFFFVLFWIVIVLRRRERCLCFCTCMSNAAALNELLSQMATNQVSYLNGGFGAGVLFFIQVPVLCPYRSHWCVFRLLLVNIFLLLFPTLPSFFLSFNFANTNKLCKQPSKKTSC